MVARSHLVAPGQAFFSNKAWESPSATSSNYTTNGLIFSDAHPARRAMKRSNVVVKQEEMNNNEEENSPARKRQRTSSTEKVLALNYQKVLPEVKRMETQRVFSNLNAENVAEHSTPYHNDTFWNQLSEWTILIQGMLRIAMFENLSSIIKDSSELYERLMCRLEILEQDVERSTVDINRNIGRMGNLKHPVREYSYLYTQMKALKGKLVG